MCTSFFNCSSRCFFLKFIVDSHNLIYHFEVWDLRQSATWHFFHIGLLLVENQILQRNRYRFGLVNNFSTFIGSYFICCYVIICIRLCNCNIFWIWIVALFISFNRLFFFIFIICLLSIFGSFMRLRVLVFIVHIYKSLVTKY